MIEMVQIEMVALSSARIDVEMHKARSGSSSEVTYILYIYIHTDMHQKVTQAESQAVLHDETQFQLHYEGKKEKKACMKIFSKVTRPRPPIIDNMYSRPVLPIDRDKVVL